MTVQTRCAYRGRVMDELPHAGPCCVPVMCCYEIAGGIIGPVLLRNCGPRRCSYYEPQMYGGDDGE